MELHLFVYITTNMVLIGTNSTREKQSTDFARGITLEISIATT